MDSTGYMDSESTDRRLECKPVDALHPPASLAEDARDGLLEPPRFLPPKYFYDARGSQLFDAICETPEYYPTRTEAALLQAYADDILNAVRPAHILEYGSGTARKTRHLLNACDAGGLHPAYWPFDICEPVVRESGAALVADYPWLQVHGLVGDYLGGLAQVPRPDGPCLFLFLGGTIGNFAHGDAVRFLSEVRRGMEPEDALLLGADRVKDPQVLHAAYNDAQGITARFNLNLLEVLNRELDGDFQPTGFRHLAHYNETRQQIEMYLVSRHAQQVNLGVLGRELSLGASERILTEISRKFTPEDMESLLHAAGLGLERHFQPENGYFSLLLARPVES